LIIPPLLRRNEGAGAFLLHRQGKSYVPVSFLRPDEAYINSIHGVLTVWLSIKIKKWKKGRFDTSPKASSSG